MALWQLRFADSYWYTQIGGGDTLYSLWLLSDTQRFLTSSMMASNIFSLDNFTFNALNTWKCNFTSPTVQARKILARKPKCKVLV